MWNVGLPWGDNWWIENEKAWFCGGEIGALFSVDMGNQQCKLETWIPECDVVSFRTYSYCIMCENTIFCLPSTGKCIWCYDMDEAIWEKIEVESKGQILMCMETYAKGNIQLCFVDDAAEVFMVNLEKRKIEKKYHISQQDNTDIGRYVIVDDKIYCVVDNKIYCIDSVSGDIFSYEIPIVDAGLYTISYDGRYFWLSGRRKEIYIWNPEEKIVKIITEFPKHFGFYHFVQNEISYLDCQSFYSGVMSFFLDSVILGKYVWYIPHQSNGILYIDRETYQVFLLEIGEESETKESMASNLMRYKFLIEYIRENRYIGIYSFKRRMIFEIDTLEVCVKDKDYKLSDKSFLSITEEAWKYSGHKVFRENKEDSIFFRTLLSLSNEEMKVKNMNIGELVYHSTLD